ncbi:hypothetical protein ACUH97_07305 [Dermabacteraceae bacterium P13088]
MTDYSPEDVYLTPGDLIDYGITLHGVLSELAKGVPETTIALKVAKRAAARAARLNSADQPRPSDTLGRYAVAAVMDGHGNAADVFLAAAAHVSTADEKRAAGEGNEIEHVRHVDEALFITASTLPARRAKAVADALEKQGVPFAVAHARALSRLYEGRPGHARVLTLAAAILRDRARSASQKGADM